MSNIIKIAIVNGPNMNLLGIREPEVYGLRTLADIETNLKEEAKKLGLELIFFQSNHEGDIVDFIQDNLNKINGIIINPAAFTKNGYSILDALTAINIPFVEVHMSNINARESWHSESIFAAKAIGHINGFQSNGYKLALYGLEEYLRK